MPSAATTAERPADEILRAIETEGHRIASYHEAIARARERAQDRESGLAEDARLVVVDRAGTWHVTFLVQAGGSKPDVKTWLLSADATYQTKAGDLSAFQVLQPPKPAPGDALAAMRAVDAARKAADAPSVAAKPPFDEAVFRDKQGPFTVYLRAKPDGRGTVKFGGDAVATIAADGQQLTEILPGHDAATAVTVPARPGSAPTLHSHVKGDLPTATDVATVIENPALAPHLVLTPRWMFRIEEGGKLTWLGPNAVPPVAPGGGH